MTLTIGIDIGTTATKAVALDPELGIVAQALRANTLSSPRAGWSEGSHEQWRANVVDLLAELAAVVAPRTIGAIATTGMVPAVVCLDRRGAVLRPPILQNDARAGREVEEIAGRLPMEDLLREVGSAVTQQSVAPTTLWLDRHEQDAWNDTAIVCGSYDWALVALGATPHIERNWAIESGLFTLTGDPFPLAGGIADVGSRLPSVAASGTVVGELDADVARVAGLPAGIPLVVGGADHVLSAYGAGLVAEGDWLVKLGGAGDILAVASSPVPDARFYLDEHPMPGLWLPNGCMATSGSLVRWVQSLLQVQDLGAIDRQAETRGAAEVLCLPYFLGEKSPLNDPDLRGVFAGLHLGHDRVDLYRSALEGIAFGFRHNAEVLASTGIALGQATVTNGGATSPLWKRIHASVLGVPLRTLRQHPGAALGAAVVAAVGVGLLPDWAAVRQFVHEDEPVEPVEAWARRYEQIYPIWQGLGAAAAIPMRALARS